MTTGQERPKAYTCTKVAFMNQAGLCNMLLLIPDIFIAEECLVLLGSLHDTQIKLHVLYNEDASCPPEKEVLLVDVVLRKKDALMLEKHFTQKYSGSAFLQYN